MTTNNKQLCLENDDVVYFDILIDSIKSCDIKYETQISQDLTVDGFYSTTSAFVKIEHFVSMQAIPTLAFGNNTIVNFGKIEMIVGQPTIQEKENLIVTTDNYEIIANPKIIVNASAIVVFPESYINTYPTTLYSDSLTVVIPDFVISGSARQIGYYYVSDWDNSLWGSLDNLYLSDIEYYVI